MYGYIYKTTNLVNGKIYIGKKKSNVFLGQSYLGSGKRFKDAVKHYGKENFKVEFIEECESLKALNEREVYWIGYCNSTNCEVGYNISRGGDGGIVWGNQEHPKKNYKMSEESRLKDSISCRGRIPWNKGKKGVQKMSEETKQKIRLGNLGKKKNRTKKHNKPMTQEHKNKLRLALLNRKPSPRAITKMSETKKSQHLHWYNNEKNEICASECPEGYTLGRLKMTDEQKLKLSLSHKGKHPWNYGKRGVKYDRN